MQQRNFWLFLLVSLTILAGWVWLQVQFAPSPKKDEDNKKEIVKKDEGQKKTEPGPKKVPPIKVEPELNRDQQMAVLLLGPIYHLYGPGAVWSVVATVEQAAEIAREEAKKKPKDLSKTEAVKTFVLGGDNFYLKAILTTRGAGLQKLTLTKFQAASWEGKPEYDQAGQMVPLELIPEDPFHPSFLMYHYAEPVTPDADNARPDTTLGERVWKLEKETRDDDKQTHTLVFTTDGPPGYEFLRLHKIYTLHAKEYHIDLKIEIEDLGTEGKRKPFRYQLAGAHGLPIEGGWYTYTFRNAVIGMLDSRDYLWRTLVDASTISFQKGGARVPQGALGKDSIQFAGTSTQYFASVIAVNNVQNKGVDSKGILAYARPTLESEEKVCFVDRWDDNKAEIRLNDEQRTKRTVVLLPRASEDLKKLQLKPGDQVVVNYYSLFQNGGIIYVAGNFRHGTVIKPFLDDISVRVVSEEIKDLSPGETVSHKFMLYHGPVKIRQLDIFRGDKAVDNELVERYASTLNLATLTDYAMPGVMGRISQTIMWTDLIIFFTKVMHWLLEWLYFFVPIEGVTIVLLTVIVRGLMFPISRKQAMTTMRMQELAPEMKKVQEKYKNDPQARNQAVMELYRKHNVNPFAGCLPLLLQMPIFLGLYYGLQESIRFRLAPFLWMDNLAAPDMMFYWGQGFPWLTDPDGQGGMLYLGPYFNLLPILAVTIMLIHQKMVMPPAQDEQQQMQQKMMTYMMIFIGIMFYKVAAGLSLYFIATTLWGMLERKFLPKKKPTPGVATATMPTSPTKPGSPKDGQRLTPAQKRKARAKGKKEEQPESTTKKLKDWWEEILKQAKKK